MPKYNVNFHATRRVVVRASMEVFARNEQEAMRLGEEHLRFGSNTDGTLTFQPTKDKPYTAIHAVSCGEDQAGIHMVEQICLTDPTQP
jgi:3-deoxy-D-manno-octulosonic-acid transferase